MNQRLMCLSLVYSLCYMYWWLILPKRKYAKKLKFWHMGTHQRVLGESYPMNTNMTLFDDLQKSLHSYALDERIIYIIRQFPTSKANRQLHQLNSLYLHWYTAARRRPILVSDDWLSASIEQFLLLRKPAYHIHDLNWFQWLFRWFVIVIGLNSLVSESQTFVQDEKNRLCGTCKQHFSRRLAGTNWIRVLWWYFRHVIPVS